MGKKIALVGGVGVIWLLTFLVMGGSALPSIDLNASGPTTSVGQGGPVGNSDPLTPSTPTPAEGAAEDPGDIAAKAEALADTAPVTGKVLVARPKPRREAAPKLTFRLASFNILGSSHTAGSKKRASGVTRTGYATTYILQQGISIVGFQELQRDQRSAFLGATGGKWGLWPSGSQRSGDGDNSIAWDKDVWDLKSTDTVPTPYFSGKIRNHPIILLRNKQTGIEVYITNFHSPADKFGNAQGWRNVTADRQIDMANQLAKTGRPVFITGDMNERSTWACKLALGADMRAAMGGHGRDGCTIPRNPFVDWIVGSYDVDFTNYVADNNVKSITDHPVIIADATVDARDFPKSVS